MLSWGSFFCKIFSLIFKQLQIILKIFLKKFAESKKHRIFVSQGSNEATLKKPNL